MLGVLLDCAGRVAPVECHGEELIRRGMVVVGGEGQGERLLDSNRRGPGPTLHVC